MGTVKAIVLGCGTSGGIPVVGNRWGACDPHNPRNRRLRSSVYVEIDGKRLLVDTSPDLRYQLLTNNIDDLDAVIYTHKHADHVHGINDLAPLGRIHQRVIPVYGTAETLRDIKHSFSYAFVSEPGAPKIYNAFLAGHEISPPCAQIEGVPVTCFTQDHGFITSLGLRFGDFAYSTDVCGLSEEAFAALEGVKVWIVDCLQYEPHETHSYFDQTMTWIERVKPEKAYLTHLSPYMDYEALNKKLPPHIAPSYDGLVIEV